LGKDKKAIPDQSRQVASMVEMGMRQDNRIYRLWVNRKRLPIPKAQRLQTLK
jgi:hypothetical protein